MKSDLKIKRTVAIIGIAACFCILLLVSCGWKDVPDEESVIANKYFDLHEIYEYGCGSVAYDKNTGVMYFMIVDGYRFGITPIYNADGSLKLYDGYEITKTEHNTED